MERAFNIKDGTLTLKPAEDKIAVEAVASVGCVSATVTFPAPSEEERDKRINNFEPENVLFLFEWIERSVLTDTRKNIRQVNEMIQEPDHE